MKLLSRVVWTEGMYLGPHHFQQQSRYFEDSIRFATSSLWFRPYGLSAYTMDAEALRNGTVAVVQARGVFPDGLPFDIPGCEPAPPPRAITEIFSPIRDSHTVSIAVPKMRPEGQNVSDPALGDFDTRYKTETRIVVDETSGRDERSVQIGGKNIRIVLDTEPADDLTLVPVARVRRDGSGRFVYDNTFVPPLLRISASEHVMMLLRRLCDLLEEKARITETPELAGSTALADHFRRDLTGFWFLHTLNSSLALLRHHLLAKRSHPEELFAAMSRLAGGLCCFALEAHPRELPLYDHDDLGATFTALDEQIRLWLEIMKPTDCVSIPLAPASPYIWAAAVDDRYLHRSRWLLELRSQAGEAATIVKTPKLVKVCSQKFVPELVRRAVPGLTLTHVPVPPVSVPAKADALYFSISKEGPCWEHIVATKQVGVYVPGDLPDAQMELHIVVEH